MRHERLSVAARVRLCARRTTRRGNRCRRTTSVCAAVRPRGPIPALVHKPGQAAPQRATSACATTAHRRCRHDAASSRQAGDAEAQGAARVTDTHCMCRANGHTLHATGNMQDPTQVEAAITSRIRPEPRPTFVCAGAGAGEAAPAAPAVHLWRKAQGLCGRSPAQGRRGRAISQH